MRRAVGERRFDVGPGFVRARECPDCGHTRCGEECVCNCDAAHAEHEAAVLRQRIADLERELQAVRAERDELLDAKATWQLQTEAAEERGTYMRWNAAGSDAPALERTALFAICRVAMDALLNRPPAPAADELATLRPVVGLLQRWAATDDVAERFALGSRLESEARAAPDCTGYVEATAPAPDDSKTLGAGSAGAAVGNEAAGASLDDSAWTPAQPGGGTTEPPEQRG